MNLGGTNLVTYDSFEISMVPIPNSEIPILEIFSTKSWSLNLGGTNRNVSGTEMLGFDIGSV